MQKETQRYNEMHQNLSNQIASLKTALREAKKGVTSAKKRIAAPKASAPVKKKPKLHDIRITARGKPNKHELKWSEKVEQLKKFKDLYGHTNVSTNRAPDGFIALGPWVADQRTQHRLLREGKPSNMSPHRIRTLTELGFQWTIQKHAALPFRDRLIQLQAYKEQHGHCNVPQKCKDSPAGLGNFVLEQRRMYKMFMEDPASVKRISVEEVRSRIGQMEALGFTWSLRNRGRSKNEAAPNEGWLHY